jgi:chitin synthase
MTLRLTGKCFDLDFCQESKHRGRYSTASYSETGATPSQGFDASTAESFANPGGPRPRYDSNQLLTLPAPLALNRPATTSRSSTSVTRSSEDVYSDNSSHQRLGPSPTSNMTEQLVEDYSGASTSAPARHRSPSSNRRTRRQTISPTPFPVEVANPFQSSHDNYYGADHDTVSPSPPPSGGQPRVRGVSLSDNGPVPAPDGVRRVSRPSGRRTSQPPQNRYSRGTSFYANLPPGAAPPIPNNGQS